MQYARRSGDAQLRNHSLRPTKLHLPLEDRTEWDDTTWFQVERYLFANLSRPGILRFIGLLDIEPTGAAICFKADFARLVRERSPAEVSVAWKRWRERR